MFLCFSASASVECTSASHRNMGRAPTLLRYSSTTDGMSLGLHNSAAFVCVSCPRERVLHSLWIHSPKQYFFFMSLGLLSLKGTLVLIPPCKHLTDVQEGNRMVQEVFEKDKEGFALSKCKFVEKRRSISEKVMGKFFQSQQITLIGTKGCSCSKGNSTDTVFEASSLNLLKNTVRWSCFQLFCTTAIPSELSAVSDLINKGH